MVNEQLWSKAEKLAARNYDVETFRDTLSNGDIVIIAKHPELPGAMAHGPSLVDALVNLQEARTEYIYSLLEDKLEVPYPRSYATSTEVPQETVISEERTIVGFGSGSHTTKTDTEDDNIAFAYRGDFIRTGS